MQKLIKNTLATTGLTLIILAVIATLYKAEFIRISSVFESFLVNTVIHIGLLFIQRFESKYFLIEILLENSYIIFVLILAGFLFHWYSSTPIWIVALMGVVIYCISYFINLFRINEDIAFINRQLKERKQ